MHINSYNSQPIQARVLNTIPSNHGTIFVFLFGIQNSGNLILVELIFNQNQISLNRTESCKILDDAKFNFPSLIEIRARIH